MKVIDHDPNAGQRIQPRSGSGRHVGWPDHTQAPDAVTILKQRKSRCVAKMQHWRRKYVEKASQMSGLCPVIEHDLWCGDNTRHAHASEEPTKWSK